MKPFYFKHITNFGDELNTWLWERLIPELLDDDAATLLIGIGTYLTSEWVPRDHRIVIFSSGAGYGPAPQIDGNWSIYCVRGPLTAKALGLDASAAVTDAGALVGRVYKGDNDKRYQVSYMPHHVSNKGGIEFWRSICNELDIHYIDPHLPVDTILAAIDQSELLITEALHGAIVADALRVPWASVQTGEHILEFKWDDWCQSLELQHSANDLFASAGVTPRGADKVDTFTAAERNAIRDQIKVLTNPEHSTLSDKKVLNERIDELERRLEHFRSDFKGKTAARKSTSGYATKVIKEAERRVSVIDEHRTDIERWSNPEHLENFWERRAQIAATMVTPNARVLDLGCGAMAVERFLPDSCTYMPCDVVSRDDRTQVCDFNKGEMPDRQDATILLLLEVLEYIYDTSKFVAALRCYNLPVIMSYIPTDGNIYTNRADHGWVNHMSWQELGMLMARANFSLIDTKRIDSGQVLLHIGPT